MKASKLLLTPKERDTAWAKQEDVCEAQVGKVLRVLAAVSEDKRSPHYQTTNHVEVFLYRIGKDIEAEREKKATKGK